VDTPHAMPRRPSHKRARVGIMPGMSAIRALVLRAPGINCDEETTHAWNLAGAKADRLHINRLAERPADLDPYQVLTLPGGFSYGDDIASGRILGKQLEQRLGDAIRAFLDRGGLVLGICNGFQVLVRMGLLPGLDCDVAVSLTLNDSARYEDRWVRLRADASRCPFIAEGDLFHLPVAHAEGKVVVQGDAAGVQRLAKLGRVTLRYIDEAGDAHGYPENPNGSIGNVAGLTDDTGRVFGLMPHPERFVVSPQSPHAAPPLSIASEDRRVCDGLRFFRNAVAHFE